MSTKAFTLVLATLLLACPTKPSEEGKKAEGPAAKEPGPQSTPPGTADDEGETPSTKAHMQDHFSKAAQIKNALIAGDLDKAREPARWMAEHQADVEHPEAWKPHVQAMREAAQGIGGATELSAATASLVTMAEACAACHTAVAGPKVELGEPPAVSEASDLAARMAVHQWALDAMWQGLTGPSKQAWVAGAEALAKAPLTPEQLAPDRSIPKEIELLATRVHTLGNEARNVEDASGIPGRIYGELLTTCETCHAALRSN